MDILSKVTVKQLVITLLLFIAIIIFFTIKYISDNLLFQPHGIATVYSAPFDVTMKNHGKTKEITSTAKGVEVPLPTGEYDVTFSADGFADHTEKMSIKDKGTYKLAFQLAPVTEKARQHLQENSLRYDPVYQSVYSIERETYLQNNLNPLGAKLTGKLPYYGGKSYTIKACEPYRGSDVNRQTRVGICIATVKEEISLITAAIDKLKELLENDIEEYDIKINNSIYPTKKELDDGVVFDCSQPGVAFCYMYKNPN